MFIESIHSVINAHPWLLLVTFFVLVAVIVVVSLFCRASRKKEIEKFAGRYGWKFSVDYKTPEELFKQTGFSFFNKEENRCAENFVTGMENSYSKVIYFDYSYETYDGSRENESERYYRYFFSCALVTLNEGELPSFRLEPETILTRMAEKTAGLQDIDFDDFPDFSDNYRLEGEDEELVRKFFNRTVLESFERQKGLDVYAKGRQMLVVKQRVGTIRIYPFLENVRDIASTLGAEIKKFRP